MTKRAETDTFIVGIDAGSVSLNASVINEDKAIVYELPYKRLFGKIDQQAECLTTAPYEHNRETPQVHIDRILSDFMALGLKSQKLANVACRCTVFSKSDMIHLQNQGERLEDIIYGFHLTKFGCGADPFIEPFYRRLMGPEPYLILELDAHSVVAGVMIRLGAFREVIENTMRKSEGNQETKLRLPN